MSSIDRYLAEKNKLQEELDERRRANACNGDADEAKLKEWLKAEEEYRQRRQELRERYFPGSLGRWEPHGKLDVSEIHTAADLWCIIEETLLPGYEGASLIAPSGNFDKAINADLKKVCKVLLRRLDISWGPELSDKPLTSEKALDELKKIAIALRQAAKSETLREQAKLLEEIPLEIAKAARNLHQVIKLWYPIDGQPWKYAQSKTASLGPRAECEVYNAQLRLHRLLDNERKPTQSDPDECPIRFARWPPDLISWRDLLGALEAMANDNHSIALHYGWTDALYNNGSLPKRKWPNVPPIPAHILQALPDDAERIEALTLPWLERIRKENAQIEADGKKGGGARTTERPDASLPSILGKVRELRDAIANMETAFDASDKPGQAASQISGAVQHKAKECLQALPAADDMLDLPQKKYALLESLYKQLRYFIVPLPNTREQLAWLDVLDGVLVAFREAEEQGLTLADIARGLGWSVGKQRRPDSAKVKRLALPDNGKTGKAKRISRPVVAEYVLANGLEFNEKKLLQ
jgi:hypothetical protein